jgi:hypothetical protein
VGGRPLNEVFDVMATLRVFLAYLVLVSGLFLLIGTGFVIEATLKQYPKSHIASFGPHVPAASVSYVELLPHVPMALYSIAAASFALVLIAARRSKTAEARTLTVAIIAAFDLYFCASSLMMLVVGYFLLPSLANAV